MGKAVEYLREAVIRWANGITNISDFETLPAHVFGISSSESTEKRSSKKDEKSSSGHSTLAKRKIRRVRKHKSVSATPEQILEIRKKMSGLETDGEEFATVRDEFAKNFGLSRRQISSIATGLQRAEKRKKTVNSK